MNRVMTVETHDGELFAKELEGLMNMGYKLKACSCGFVNSEQYDFCSAYHAVLVLGDDQ